MSSVPGRETPYGFEWGAAKVQRLFDGRDKGWVMVGIETPKADIQVYITRTGKVRIFSPGAEWTLPPKKPARGQ